MFLRYFAAHPEEAGMEDNTVMLDAMQQAYPCGEARR
jgi:hypothetical protein